MLHLKGCVVCGDELEYFEDSKEEKCFICQTVYPTNTHCINGHFVCDACHSLDAKEHILIFCSQNQETDPFNIAQTLMQSPKLKMHGPEHHFLVPAALLTAYYNKMGKAELKSRKLKIARQRSENVLGGYCGLYGTCGAAVGTGIFISLITEATPLSKEEWRLCNLMTSRSLYSIAMHGGPRCCKRDTYLAIQEGVLFLEENFDTVLPGIEDIRCNHSEWNNECLEEQCVFWKDRP
jgi:hypothetical protein